VSSIGFRFTAQRLDVGVFIAGMSGKCRTMLDIEQNLFRLHKS
jgi:hypothetical protein